MTTLDRHYLELDHDEACYLYHAAVVAGWLNRVDTDEWKQIYARYQLAVDALGEERRLALGRKLHAWAAP